MHRRWTCWTETKSVRDNSWWIQWKEKEEEEEARKKTLQCFIDGRIFSISFDTASKRKHNFHSVDVTEIKNLLNFSTIRIRWCVCLCRCTIAFENVILDFHFKVLIRLDSNWMVFARGKIGMMVSKKLFRNLINLSYCERILIGRLGAGEALRSMRICMTVFRGGFWYVRFVVIAGRRPLQLSVWAQSPFKRDDLQHIVTFEPNLW